MRSEIRDRVLGPLLQTVVHGLRTLDFLLDQVVILLAFSGECVVPEKYLIVLSELVALACVHGIDKRSQVLDYEQPVFTDAE